MNGCKHTPRIHALHDGELSPGEAAELQRHITGCRECADELASCRAISAQFRAAPRPAAPAGLAHRVQDRIDDYADSCVFRLAGWLTSAAAMILVACLLRLGQSETNLGGDMQAPAWEPAVSYAGLDAAGTSGSSEERQFAQWMVDDLSGRPQ